MYHISEENHCTGCGGAGRPSCAVLRCAGEHGGIAYCFQCPEYPCARYEPPPEYDSFVSARNVRRDFARAESWGLERYQAVLEEKMELLRFLLQGYNDGRRKSFFCLAANLLELEDLHTAVARLRRETGPGMELKERAALAVQLLGETAAAAGVVLKLKRPPRGGKK